MLACTASAQKAKVAGDPEAMWAVLAADAKGFYTARTHGIERFIEREELALRYRELGLAFSMQFPEDPRRWEWLEQTLRAPPQYWQDLPAAAAAYAQSGFYCGPRDSARELQWDQRYRTTLRPALFASPQVGPQFEASVLELELDARGVKSYELLKCGMPIDLNGFVSALMEYSAHPMSSGSASRNHGSVLIHYLDRQSDASMEATVLAEMKRSPHAELRALAEGRERVLGLRGRPVDFTFTTHDGSQIDFTALRGKVVLVDGWSNWCSSCIEALPKIRQMRERYRDADFEVIGITFAGVGFDHDSKSDEGKILKAIEEKGADWPIGMLKDQAAQAFLDRYGIIGFPFTWIIGRDGRLVSSVTLHGEELEAKVGSFLGVDDRLRRRRRVD